MESLGTGLVVPDKPFLKQAIKVLHKRYDMSKKVVDDIRPDIERYRAMYACEAVSKLHQWEANLVIPKARYIVDTITPQIMSTIFSKDQWLTTKNINIPDTSLMELDRWLVWFCDKYMKWYLQALQLFKSSPIDGTSFAKLFMQNGLPTLQYDDILNFYPDPSCHTPGDVDSMEYCFHQIDRTFSQLERATVPKLLEVINPTTQDVLYTLGVGPMYSNMDKLYEKYPPSFEVDTDKGKAEEYRPPYELLEYYGEIETTFGVFDVDKNRYKPGKYDEYIITTLKEGLETDDASLVLRAENSTFSYTDSLSGRETYLKPFIVSLYSVEPGKFYGGSALKPVESLIAELTDFHNLFLDNLKRSVMTVLKVLKNTGLEEEDLEMKPYALWYVRDQNDVQAFQAPTTPLTGLHAVDMMLSQEIDRSSTPQAMQGVPVSKRQTSSEFQGLLAEGARRFATFIQSADRLTLRPFVQKVKIFLSKIPSIVEGRAFQTPFGEVQIDPKWLTDAADVSFAATGVEPEHSIYMKQELFPQILQSLTGLVAQSNGAYRLNVPSIIKELEPIYGFKDAESMVESSGMFVSLQALITVMQTAAQSNPALAEMVPVMANLVEMAQQYEMQMAGAAPPSVKGGVAQVQRQVAQEQQAQQPQGGQNVGA